jgi:putative ABC transport system ATP-binding protein
MVNNKLSDYYDSILIIHKGEPVMEQVLQVSHIKKCYGNKGSITNALDDVTFGVEQGEFIGIMGASGSGKTTLLNCISTIDKVTSGNIFIRGKNITELKANKLARFRREELGFIFQDYNLLDTMTLRENIALPLVLSKKDAKTINTEVKNVASVLGIENLLGKYPYEVSGGQKQRAAAARAIVNNPELILADEPTGALDSKASRELLQCLQRLNDNTQATIMLVTHDAFAASFCKRILFIKDGALYMEILNGGSRKEFFDRILKVLSSLGGDNSELL